ncbi:hypothetical protein FEMY_24820 [Ferrovum myxofaciens]|uniref:Transposase n=1 Tax=Ferrovum myxofaciens TaxID=416213 RepID=A0A149VUV4_9PROT|nr:hypothetical protein FEMY_24820 [Ferrovum myxofaciens]
MTDILHLPHLRALSVQDCGDHYQIETIGNIEPTACPACASSLYRHGSQRQVYIDTPIHGKRSGGRFERKSQQLDLLEWGACVFSINRMKLVLLSG